MGFSKLLLRAACAVIAAVAVPIMTEPAHASCSDVAGVTVRDSVLTVAASVRSLPARAFADRTDFNRVVFAGQSSLTEIGEYAFLGCSRLREIELPARLKKIGEGAFRECSALQRVAVPAGVRKLDRYTFSWCTSLADVSLPAALADIGSGCFSYCTSLRLIDLPGAITHIGANVFSYCTSLEEIKFPSSITELESYACSECRSLRRATLPGNRHLLGELIFSGCQALETITINSPVPPEFDCNSTLFEDNERFMYSRCRLLVPARALDAYRRAPSWRLFQDITPL